MNEETLNKWVEQYESQKTLPSKKLPCTTEGCATETTAFGTNLAGKVEKAGSIRALLSGFKCRGCKKSEKTSNNIMSDSIKDSVKAMRSKRTEELVKAATITNVVSEVSTEDILNVFAEV